MSAATLERGLDVFQDLYLRGPTAGRPALRQAVLDQISAPWRNANGDKVPVTSTRNGDALAFERAAGGDLAAAGLVLWSRPDGYEIGNIVPLEPGELSFAAYNAILQDFVARVAEPAAGKTGFTVETTPARQSLDAWLSPQAQQALRRFSRAANKATGSTHPADRQRWFWFLLQVHADKQKIGTLELERWLTEIEGWGEKRAGKLVVEYEFALHLLDTYDEHGR